MDWGMTRTIRSSFTLEPLNATDRLSPRAGAYWQSAGSTPRWMERSNALISGLRDFSLKECSFAATSGGFIKEHRNDAG